MSAPGVTLLGLGQVRSTPSSGAAPKSRRTRAPTAALQALQPRAPAEPSRSAPCISLVLYRPTLSPGSPPRRSPRSKRIPLSRLASTHTHRPLSEAASSQRAQQSTSLAPAGRPRDRYPAGHRGPVPHFRVLPLLHRHIGVGDEEVHHALKRHETVEPSFVLPDLVDERPYFLRWCINVNRHCDVVATLVRE